MPIALSDDHRTLADTARGFLGTHEARAAGRRLLEAADEPLPSFWKDLGAVGWLGLHVPEAHHGSGYGLAELAVVVEEFGRAVAPGPFVPTVIASAVLAAAPPAVLDGAGGELLAGLVDGSLAGGVGLGGTVTLSAGRATGDGGTVLGAGLADVLLLTAGDDVIIVRADDAAVRREVPANLDPTRRSGRVTLDGVEAIVLPGARASATALARTILAAEAVGIAREGVDSATQYAKEREQFGRPIAMFQAVKHHCANMLVAAELATAATWDAARAAATGGEQFELAAATAALHAAAAALGNAHLDIQVHGGIGVTWEHDAHLLLRRAAVLDAVLEPERCAAEVSELAARGVRRDAGLELPPEAEPIRDEVRRFVAELARLDEAQGKRRLIDEGYAMPHWPTPWGRGAGAIEQLVIDEEFAAAGIARPQYGITGWVVLTLIQHGTPDQVARWVRPTLDGDLVWCQLFSEPNAGSDAAGVTTRAVRVDGGWLINGQKVWTSGAHYCQLGLATVRTDAAAKKHQGITTVVIDMHARGVEIRPLRQLTGDAEFNEVFFTDVFVPDDDVVGQPNAGWTVARATLGNERVSIGGGAGERQVPGLDVVARVFAHPERLPGGLPRLGRFLATVQAMRLLNLRGAQRAVAGGEPGPEGNVTKLVLADSALERAAIVAAVAGPDLLFLDGDGLLAGLLVLGSRSLSIAGGTSEITRNQIGERILGLPRDPLLK